MGWVNHDVEGLRGLAFPVSMRQPTPKDKLCTDQTHPVAQDQVRTNPMGQDVELKYIRGNQNQKYGTTIRV